MGELGKFSNNLKFKINKMLYIIPIVIIILSLIWIFFIIAKKLAQVSLIDVNTIPEERERTIKDKIMVDRLKRKTSAEIAKFESILTPIFKKIKNFGETTYDRMLELEKKYQEKGRKRFLDSNAKNKIKMLLEVAQDYLDKDDFMNAENKYIEIISLDHRNMDAYKKLADIYLKQKDYEHAKEILTHGLKINRKDEEVYRKLGNLLEEKGDFESALENYLKIISLNPKKTLNYAGLAELYRKMENYEKEAEAIEKAVFLDPNNQKYLDLLVNVYIILKNNKKAHEAYERLKIANPENEKLDEIKRKIEGMG